MPVGVDLVDLRKALSGPGMDPRQWVSFGIVEPETKDQKSVTYDDDLGPLVTVRLVPSNLLVICRVSGSIAGNGEGEYFPFIEQDEVVVLIPEGNERAGCTIIGRMNNGIDKFPDRIAGLDTNGNNFGFRRLRTAYIIETASRYMIRSAKSNAFFLIDEGGNITHSGGSTEPGGEAPFLHIGADFVGFQTGDGSGSVQVGADSSTGQMVASATAGDTKLTLANDGSGLSTPGNFNLSAYGIPPMEHVLTVEAFIHMLPPLVAAILLSGAVLTPGWAIGGPPPSPTSPAYPAVLGAISAIPVLPMFPGMYPIIQQSISKKIPSIPEVVAAGGTFFPGIGCPGFLTG